MAIPVYPEGLPYPLRENYARTPTNNIRRTPMDSGRARQRIEFPNAPDTIQLTWIFTAPQAMLFTAWAAQVVGAGWFTMPLLSPLGFNDEEVRFTEVPVGGELTGKFLWRYRVVCESRNRPLLPPGWAELLPSFVLNPEIFDYAMNDEWPLNPWQVYILETDQAINEEWPTP
ncbi:hypothetical protein D3C87_1298600 [compost metagenome]